MLRPASPDALDRLLDAAGDVDRELDMALVRLGVLPPLDLSTIRSWLTLRGVAVAARANTDGHRVIEVLIERRVVASIQPDGSVVTPLAATA
ncbi:MAG: hypothetical protein CL424_17515 [Acidimicrobiaceae bacterium]|nr:hypothetical protein [Acidimicrobiaceae bacterium]